MYEYTDRIIRMMNRRFVSAFDRLRGRLARLDEISGRPEVAQFTKSLIEYMTSASFKPMQGLSPAQLRALFTAEGS